MRQKSYSATHNSDIRKNFEKLGRKCSINLTGRNSSGLWLKKNPLISFSDMLQELSSIWHFKVVDSYSLPCPLCHPARYFFSFNQNPPESLLIKLNEHFLHNFRKLLRIIEIDVADYAF